MKTRKRLIKTTGVLRAVVIEKKQGVEGEGCDVESIGKG